MADIERARKLTVFALNSHAQSDVSAMREHLQDALFALGEEEFTVEINHDGAMGRVRDGQGIAITHWLLLPRARRIARLPALGRAARRLADEVMLFGKRISGDGTAWLPVLDAHKALAALLKDNHS